MHEESDQSARDSIVDEGGAESPGRPSASGPPPGEPSASADPSQEAARLKEAWLRTAADFDNFRKRSRREIDDARRSGREELVKALLPVFDNLERALQSAQRSTDVRAMVDGLSMVQRQFTDALGREGIARVPTVGRPFDPSVHEAISQVESAEHAPGTVLSEVQPGYTFGDRLLRAAMVVVAKPKSDDGSTDATSN